MYAQGGRNADNDGVNIKNSLEITCSIETSFNSNRYLFNRDVLDVSLAGVKLLDLFFINIESNGLEAFFWKTDYQRQTNVAEANDGDGGLMINDIWF